MQLDVMGSKLKKVDSRQISDTANDTHKDYNNYTFNNLIAT